MIIRSLAVAAWMISTVVSAQSFREQQLQFPRVRAAFEHKSEGIADKFRAAGFRYPPREILLRIFKQEKELEVGLAPPVIPLLYL